MSRDSASSPLAFARRKAVWIPSLLLGLVLVALVGVFALQASRANAALQQAASDAQTLKDNLSKGDAAKSKTALIAFQESTEDARVNTRGALWTVASNVPFAGKNISAVQTVASVLDALADKGLPPVVDVASTLDLNTFSPKDGRIDLRTMVHLAPAVSQASVVLADGDRELTTVNADNLAGPLQQPVRDLQSKVHDAHGAAAAADTALKVLPAMMGVNEDRTYLVIFQNNAELRSTGGLPGAWATVNVKNGRIKLDKQGSATDLPPLENPVRKLTDEETEIYAPKMGKDFRDVNFTPDWPRAAYLAQAILKRHKNISVDGVMSIDPVALSYALRGTGPVKLADGTKLTSDNTVDQLLNQVYVDYPEGKAQDIYFASAAKQIFEAVSSGIGDSTSVVKQLVKAGREGRILIWSKHKDEERVLMETQVSGALRRDTGKTPQVGLYLNDGTGAKMNYYLETSNEVQSQHCSAKDVQTLVATTTLKSTAPSDAKLLPESIIGPGFGAPAGSMLVNLRAYAPFGGHITGGTINGKKSDLFTKVHNGRPLAVVSALLQPGDSRVITVTMKTGKGQSKAAKLTATPGVRTRNEKTESSCSNE